MPSGNYANPFDLAVLSYESMGGVNKVVVLGSINQDVIVLANRHPVPGETVRGRQLLHLPGGKGANEAVAIACAGVEAVLIGAVGDDAAAKEMLAFLDSRGVNTSFVQTINDMTTGTAVITVDARGENSIVIVPAANDYVLDNEKVQCEAGDVLLSQFEVPFSAIHDFFERGRRSGCRTVLNPSPVADIPARLMPLIDVLVVNETELAMLSGKSIDTGDRPAVATAALALKESGSVVVTLGAGGAIATLEGRVIDIDGIQVKAVDTTGAGDCFVGSLAAELAAGSDFFDALHYANRAASVCVTRPGAGPSMPTREEVN